MIIVIVVAMLQSSLATDRYQYGQFVMPDVSLRQMRLKEIHSPVGLPYHVLLLRLVRISIISSLIILYAYDDIVCSTYVRCTYVCMYVCVYVRGYVFVHACVRKCSVGLYKCLYACMCTLYCTCRILYACSALRDSFNSSLYYFCLAELYFMYFNNDNYGALYKKLGLFVCVCLSVCLYVCLYVFLCVCVTNYLNRCLYED